MMMQYLVVLGLAAVLLLIAIAALAINLFFNRKTNIRSCSSSKGCDCVAEPGAKCESE